MKRIDMLDRLIALSLVVAYVWLALSSVAELGYARDEGFYFAAASTYERWLDILLQNPARALERATLDRHWAANSEHPAFMKSLFALSHHYLCDTWGWISEPGTAYRFPGMAVSALALGILYVWGRQTLGRAAGLVAACAYAAMPRVFYHSHLCAFDAPVASLWLLAAYLYWRAWQHASWFWAVLTGVGYGFLLNTKHNSWLLPGALVLHALLTRASLAWRVLRSRWRVRSHAARLPERELGSRVRRILWRNRRSGVPRALLLMLTLGPLLFYAMWPWIWHDTAARLLAYARFHLGHDYYNMEFLGRTYWKPPMPRLYAWVMTLATVPAITLLLFGIGVVRAFGRDVCVKLGALRWRRGRRLRAPAVAHPPSSIRARQRRETYLLWALGLVVNYAPWFSSDTPIFGGTKHWLTSYPFMCLFAAAGFSAVRHGIARIFQARNVSQRRWFEPALALVLFVCVLAGPVWMTAASQPFGLSSYTPLVGGAPGAASLGLNRTFWGYTIGSLQEFLSTKVPHNGSVYVHDTALQSFAMLKQERRISPELRGTLELHKSDIALYQHEPHMSRVEYQIWVDYGTTRPVIVESYEGVPITWAYERPLVSPSQLP